MSLSVDLQPGDEVISFFVLRKKEIRTSRESKELYLALELGDAAGRISGSFWNEAKKVYDSLEVGDVVKLKAHVIDFKNKKHLSIQKIRKAGRRDDIDWAQLIPKVDQNLEDLLRKLDETIESVEQGALKILLQSIFGDERLRNQVAHAPGGKLWHHNYIGGLLEHTLCVTDIACELAAIYPDANRDLVVAGGLLHDIGKIYTYTYKTVIDFTDEGRLLGHIVLGSQLVNEKIALMPEFPEELQRRLIHLILSHQGKLEQASPVVPMTLEALLLYYADEIDSKANAFLRIKKREGSHRWSSYVNLMERYFYFGENE